VIYYFLVASLPAQAWGDPPALAAEEFRARCVEQLSAPDLAELDAVLAGWAGPGGTSSFAVAWRGFETHLRGTVARTRALRLGLDVAPYRREGERWENSVLEAVEDAFARPHPLEREQELDRFRWARLDDLGLGHFFDLTAVLIYGLRRQLCERWAGLTVEAGRARMEQFLQASGVST
jgi:hypothetical protein